MNVGGMQFWPQQVSYAERMVEQYQLVDVWHLRQSAHHPGYGFQCAVRYYLLVTSNSWFVTVFHLPYHHRQHGPGVLGLYYCGSSPRAQAERSGQLPGWAVPTAPGEFIMRRKWCCAG